MNVTSLSLQLAPAAVVIAEIRKIPDWPNIAAQEHVASLLLTSHQAKYPAPDKCWKYLFKCIEKDILSFYNTDAQDAGVDIFSDSLMELIVESQTLMLNESDVGYMSFCSVNSDIIIATRVVRSHNQVGMTVWGAGMYLGELLQRVPELLAERTVLELGAGVGITGLLLSRGIPLHQQPYKIIMTDFHSDVLDLLASNIAVNCAPTTAHTLQRSPCIVETATMDWCSVQKEDFIAYNSRVVIAADCTYSEIGNVHLLRAFKCFLRGMTNKSEFAKESIKLEGDVVAEAATLHIEEETAPDGKRYLQQLLDTETPLILIACTVRGAATYKHFIDLVAMGSPELHMENLTAWASTCFPAVPLYHYQDSRDSIQLWCIHLRSSSRQPTS